MATRCRKHFIKWVRTAATTDKTVEGVPVSTWLLDTDAHPGITTMDQYLETMSTWGTGPAHWGGFPEVVVLCCMWDAWVVLLQESADGMSWTVRSCVGSTSKHPKPICILRSRTEDHWDAVQLPPSTVTKLQNLYKAGTRDTRGPCGRRSQSEPDTPKQTPVCLRSGMAIHLGTNASKTACPGLLLACSSTSSVSQRLDDVSDSLLACRTQLSLAELTTAFAS